MRKLKFRAWAKTGYMFNVTYLSWNRKMGLEYVRGERCDGKGTIGGHEKFIDMNNIILMQFTGLLDKNEKEIYEGDIISRGEPHEVFWQKRQARFILLFQGNYRTTFSALEGHMNEVIGNIYENPELTT